METSVLKKRILADLEELPQSKVSEVFDFVEYLKVRQKNWRERFRAFLRTVEPKMKNVSYPEITREVKKVREK